MVAKSVLSRYLDPEVLSRVADRHIEPRGLVIGNLAGAHKSPLSGFAVEFAGHRVKSKHLIRIASDKKLTGAEDEIAWDV